MIVNSLPVKTFSHLNMNEANVDYIPGASKKIIINESGIYDFKDAADIEVEIKVLANTSLKIIMNYFTSNTLNIKTNVIAEEKSDLTLIQIGDADKENRLINSVKGELENDASVTLVQLFPGKGEVFSDAIINLNGEGSSFNADVAYLTKSNQHTDMNYVANHFGRKTKSNIQTSGAVLENGFKTMRQTIDFKTGASGAKGLENEKVILLGDELINQSLPIILCSEEDVEGAHGSQIGSLDDEMIFYLASRGIDEEAAKKLIIFASFNKLLKYIDDGDFKQKTFDMISECIYEGL